MRSRGQVLELAILGALHETPMHGYELRKRLNLVLGSFRALSYGSLYPALKSLVTRGLIVGTDSSQAPPPHALSGKRARIVYELTADGKEHFLQLLAESGPDAWEDGGFDVRFALFAQTDADTRLRILEGRRLRLTERLDNARQAAARLRERLDDYTLELQRHGLEQVEREVAWLDGLIDNERGAGRAQAGGGMGRPPSTEGDRPAASTNADDASAPQH